MLGQRYLSWLSLLDREKFEALADGKVWVFILTTFLIIIATLAYAPVVSAFFSLQPGPVILALVPVVICAILISSVSFRDRLSLGQLGLLMIVTSAVFQLFMWSLVCFSELPGATMLAALPILLAAYHCEFFQLSPSHPWGASTILFALTGAYLMSPDGDHDAIILVGGLIAFGAAFTMGNHARIQSLASKERDAMKAAIDAQTLLDRVQEVEQTQLLLTEIRGTNHDAGNALSGILMNLEFVTKILNSPTITDEDIQEMREMAEDLSAGSNRLRSLIEKGKQTGKGVSEQEITDVDTIIEQVVNEVKTTYPRLEVVQNLNHKTSALRLHGGALSLHRVLYNLIANAAEGNGREVANRVELTTTNDDQTLQFNVSDNGPGFSKDQLDRPLSTIKTTKESGTGLGLYTTKRLITANKGELKYENKPNGGASVAFYLPV